MSDTDLVDSTSPSAPPVSSDVPRSGSWTNTTSPRASWAKSVIPIRTLPSSSRAHSWSFVYRRSSGTFTGQEATGSPQHLADAAGVLLGECAGLGVAAGLGPDVGDGLLRVGQHEHPPVLVQDLDAVDHHHLPVLDALDEGAHHQALLLPRCDDAVVHAR